MTDKQTCSLIEIFQNQATLRAGVTETVLQEAENTLRECFPAELREVLLLTDGVKSHEGKSLLWSTSEILEKNMFFRNDEEIRKKYMPLNDFLFFSDAPCNGLFGYPITPRSRQRPWIFQWNGITDARKVSTAHDLEQLYTWLLIDSERAQIFLRRMNDISGWDVPEPRFERVIAKMKEEDWEVFEPASIAEIKEVENSLGLCLPEALKQVYLFSNGLNSQIGFRIFSIQELLIEDSLIKAEHREVDWYMPADSFLFFAPEGNGDYYGFPVTSSGIGNSVMQLDHETDTRDYFAQNLFELLHYQLELDDDDE